jgi:hypothetical protein
MRIEIDTRESSPEELRLAAQLLERLASNASTSASATSASEDVDPSALPAAFGLFDDDNDDDASSGSSVDEPPVERARVDDDFRIIPY